MFAKHMVLLSLHEWRRKDHNLYLFAFKVLSNVDTLGTVR